MNTLRTLENRRCKNSMKFMSRPDIKTMERGALIRRSLVTYDSAWRWVNHYTDSPNLWLEVILFYE